MQFNQLIPILAKKRNQALYRVVILYSVFFDAQVHTNEVQSLVVYTEDVREVLV